MTRSQIDELLSRIREAVFRSPYQPKLYEDWISALQLLKEIDKEAAYRGNKELRKRCQAVLPDMASANHATRIYEVVRKSYLFSACDNFSDFMFYIEWDRPPEKRFYQPRMKYLRPMVQGYQDILDGNLDLLTVSQPKRTGKSQTEINFVNMLSGRHPDRSTLIEGAGDALVNSFYKGCLEYFQDPQYRYFDVFPDAQLVGTNADLKTINLRKKRRFPTIMCRSIDATQVGLSEATNALVLDDCVLGREEAMNRARLDQKWEIIRGDVLGRRIEGTPIIATGTRYSLYDPIGRLQEEARSLGWRWRAIEIPALDPDTDESNYEHERDGKKVFTTAYFRGERELLSSDQWESEFQQQPFEAKGLLFPEDKLQRYFKLPPDRDPDAIVATCDTKEKGEDYVMMPVAYLYGTDVFIEDVVFDDGPPDSTKPQCAKTLFRHKVSRAVFESNNAGEYYARDVEDLLTKLGGNTSIQVKRTISNKATRIEMASDNILKHFWFKDKSQYEKRSQYAAMVKALVTYTRTGKNAHDDCPDGLALLENMLRESVLAKAEPMKRPF